MPGRDLPDLEERLRQLPAAPAVRAPAGLAGRVAHRGRVRRRLRRAGAATVVAALLAGAVLTRAVVLDRTPAPVLNPGLLAQNATPAQLAGGRWQALAPLPARAARPPRPGGGGLDRRELLVGTVQEAGDTGGSTAAAYDPATDRWRLLPPSPGLSGGARTLDARTAVWAGSRLLVWNFLRATPRSRFDETDAAGRPDTRPDAIDLWAYDPAAGRWSILPSPPEPVRAVAENAAMVWDGREVVVASARNASAGGRRRLVTRAGRYDPDRAAWTPIDPPPRPVGANLGRVVLTWTGSALVEPGNAAYDPATDRWLPLPDEPDPRATPPVSSGDAAHALLRVRSRADGTAQVWVLTPSPSPRPAGP